MKLFSMVIIMIFCISQALVLNECQKCQCCKDQARCYHTNSTSDHCKEGCIDGYYGDLCTHACIDNCLTCADEYSCTKCIHGYYGTQCRRCPSNCLNCSKEDICELCQDGYYNYYPNDKCRRKCLQHCKSCSKLKNNCNACKDGFYNGKYKTDSINEFYDCRHQCQNNCISCTSYDVCEECKSGFYNNKIIRNCSLKCKSECKSCMSYNDCNECEYGYYQSNKNCAKCKSSCLSCSSHQNCTACIPGKFNGRHTDCRESCRQECTICNSYDQCIDCVKGWYGKSCENQCGRGCLYGNCSATTGMCDCKRGFDFSKKCGKCLYYTYGVDCDKRCSEGCLDHICDDNGNCVRKCNAGFVGDKCDNCEEGRYGKMCVNYCPDGCADKKCSSDGTCYSCKTGWYGQKCARSCPAGCELNNCSIDGKCYSCKKGFIGLKCERCVNGMYGNECDKNCSPSCLVCVSLNNCSVCVDNHWGNTCLKCPTHCQKCSSESNCSACNIGYFGPICNKHCPSNCLARQCDQFTRNCTEGCVVGFYGTICDMRCSPNCINSVCVRENGECSLGCKAGFNGTTCNHSVQLNIEDGKNMELIVGASAGGSLLILLTILIIVAVLLLKRRQRQGKKDKNDMKEATSESGSNTYNEINDTNLTAGNKSKNGNNTNEKSHEIMTYKGIEDTERLENNQETDVIYAKPIKPKRKSEGGKTSNGSSTATNNFYYDVPKTSRDKTVNTVKGNRSSIPISTPLDDNKTTRVSDAKISTVNKLDNEIDFALEIEEDIENLSSKSTSVILEENAKRAAELDSVDTYYNVGAVKKRKIKLDKLLEFVSNKTEQDFDDEFQTLPAMLIKPYVESQKRENLSKNRYKGIYPYDDTRVVLKDGDSDYINASYIDGYNKNRAYIASTGPTTKYMSDMSAFWIMVWQEKVEKIVMLTHLIEGGVPKCDKYWPEKDFSLTFANIQVTCLNEEEYSDYTCRTFSVQKDTVKRKIYHLHFTAWPDKGTPDDVTSLIEFRQKVNSTKTQLDGPVIVHCSAGIGRTGTYIALDSISREGKAKGEVDIFAFVRNMREQRVHMIQTAEQYRYLHNTIVHTLTFDSEAIVAFKFSEYMKSHTEDHLGKMFEKLQASVEQRSDDEKEAVKRNTALKNKNRDGADIPGDRNRPKLYIARTLGSLDYINSVYVNSFKNMNRFLIAQTPLPETVEDFLALIVQEKVSCVINMETSSSNDMNVGIYCPADNHPLKKGAFTVKAERGKGTDQFMLRKMKISYSSNSGSEEVTVPHVQFTQWGESSITPEDPGKFVQFINEMELKLYGNDTNRPILVHCSTGATRSGLFCVVSTLLEKTQIDQEVSVVNTVRQIKYRRHMAIPNKDQYIFCHQCVNEYLRKFELYSNFEVKS